MRVLVIAPQPFFTPRGTPFSVYYRTLLTAELGAKVDLLTYGEGQDVDIPGVRLVRIPRIPGLRNVKVGPSLTKLLLDVVLVAWTIGMLATNRYDVVHAHEEAVFFCRFLKPIFRFKLVYDMHSSLPQQLTNFKFTTSRFLIRAFEMLEDSALRSADAVITICPELAEYALPRLPEPSRHVLIENSIFDDVRVKGSDETPQPEDSAPSLPFDRPIIAYAGTLEPYQGIDLLIRAFAETRRELPDAWLLMVGGTPEQVTAYRRLARELSVDDRIVFTGRAPQSVAKSLIRRATVLTSPRIEGTNTPLKIYEQLASGIPLVATRILSHTQVLDDSVCILVDPSPKAMARGLITAVVDHGKRQSVVAAAQSLYEERYSRRAYTEKMLRLLRSVA